MAIEQRNRSLLNRKEFQQMTPAPVASAASMFVIADSTGIHNLAMYVTSAALQYLYYHDEDAYLAIPTAGLATFSFPSGLVHPCSNTYTTNGGSTTTITVAAATHNINSLAVGSTVEILTNGANTASNGERRIITSILNNAGAGTITLTVDRAFTGAILTTGTFRLTTGRFFVWGGGVTAAGTFKSFDPATMAWSGNLVVTGVPTFAAQESELVTAATTPRLYATGLAVSGTVSTLVTTNNWVVDQWKNYWLCIIDGTGEGQQVQILSNTATTLTFANNITSADATSVYEIRNVKRSVVGKATAGSATTLVHTGKTWAVNQFTNSQVRIVSGTGKGQKSLIASNTADTLTIASGATLDSTSVYEIEGDENSIYLLGNLAVTMYKYSISANTWATVAPTTARAGAVATGHSAGFVGITGDSVWGDETNIQDGRYIYSFRGGATGTLDRFDIAGGTAGAGAWANVVYVITETFTAGSSFEVSGRYIYIRKEATHRYFKYSLIGNYIEPLTTNIYPDGAAAIGNKIWVKNYDPQGVIKWLYSLMNTGTVLHRIMLY